MIKATEAKDISDKAINASTVWMNIINTEVLEAAKKGLTGVSICINEDVPIFYAKNKLESLGYKVTQRLKEIDRDKDDMYLDISWAYTQKVKDKEV